MRILIQVLVLLLLYTPICVIANVVEYTTALGFKIFSYEYSSIPITSISFAFRHNQFADTDVLPLAVIEVFKNGFHDIHGGEYKTLLQEKRITIDYTFDRDFFYIDVIAPPESIDHVFYVLSSTLTNTLDDHALEITKYIKNVFTNENMLVSIAGVIDPITLGGIFDKYMINIYNNEVDSNDTSSCVWSHMESDSSSSIIQFILKTSLLHEWQYVLSILQNMLSSTFSHSILNAAMQDMDYSVSTMLTHAEGCKPALVGRVFVDPKDKDVALLAVKKSLDQIKHLKRYSAKNPERYQRMFEVSQKYLITMYNTKFHSSKDLARFMLDLQKIGLSADEIDTYTDKIISLSLKDMGIMTEHNISYDIVANEASVPE